MKISVHLQVKMFMMLSDKENIGHYVLYDPWQNVYLKIQMKAWLYLQSQEDEVQQIIKSGTGMPG